MLRFGYRIGNFMGSHLFLRYSMASLESRYVWHSQTGVYKNIPKESAGANFMKAICMLRIQHGLARD